VAYSFHLDGGILELGLETVVGLLEAAELGGGGLKLRLGVLDLGRQLPLHLLHLLGPDAALAALALLLPLLHLGVRLLHQPLQLRPSALLLLYTSTLIDRSVQFVDKSTQNQQVCADPRATDRSMTLAAVRALAPAAVDRYLPPSP